MTVQKNYSGLNTTLIHQLKRKIEELEEEKERYTELFEQSNDAIALVTTEGKIFGLNKKWKEMTGFSEKDIINKSIMDLMPLQERQRGKNLFRENLKKGDIELETKTLTKNKGLRDINVKAKVMNIGGKPFVQAIVRDITEKKKAEELKNRFFNIFESTPDFVGFADARDKHIIYINRAGRKMVGIGEKENISKIKIQDVHPDWTNKLLLKEVMPTAINKGVWQGKCAFLHKDGHEIPTSMVLNAHKNANGNVEIFSTISRDITEDKNAERALKESEEKFRTIFENAGEGILIADAKTKKFIFANPRICNILGYKEKELLKLKVNDIHPKKDLPHVMEQFKKQFQKKILTAASLPVLRKDRKVIFCDITATPLIINGKECLAGFFLEK